MLTVDQNLMHVAEVAVNQLQTEARYFDLLADQFPIYKRSLTKHAQDCHQAVSNFRKKIKSDSSELLSASVGTANLFLLEGKRLRLKLRLNLLQQEATGLALEGGRWPTLESEFTSMAERCRTLIGVCKTTIYKGSLSDIEELLPQATALREKSIRLRQKQKDERHQDARMRLLQVAELLNDHADYLKEKLTSCPSHLSTKYTQLSVHCQTVAAELKGKAEHDSLNKIEKAIAIAENFIVQVKNTQSRTEFPDRLYQEVQVENKISLWGYPDLKNIHEVQRADQTADPELTISVLEVDGSEIKFDTQESTSQWPKIWLLIKHVIGQLVFALIVVSRFLFKVTDKTLRNVITFAERVFMFAVVALVVVTFVFVLTYLSGSGFSRFGLF